MDKFIEYLDNNTVSKIETRFLRGVEIVQKLTKEYEVPNENWTYPWITFGDSEDPYYAEIWYNGMDYNNTFYLLEQINYSIKVHLLMDIDGDDWINMSDPKEFFNCIFWMRRDRTWIKTGNYGRYNDDVLPYITFGKKEEKRFKGELSNITFQHASQPKIDFLINKDLIINERRDKLLNIEKNIKEMENFRE